MKFKIRRILLLMVLLFFSHLHGFAEREIRIMTFNLWHGGDGGGQPLEHSLEVIKAAQADIVGLQETHGQSEKEPRPDHAKKLAEMLGWHYFDQGKRTGILSRFPIEKSTPRKQGVSVLLPDGGRIYIFNVHFNHAPYQPYQLLEIPYAGAPFLKTESELIAAAVAARGSEADLLLEDAQSALRSGWPLFLTGDFNEPSHLDWTEAAARAGKVPAKVDFPTTRKVMAAGFKDAFREAFPDETKHRGNTWTPIKAEEDPTERHDRIDFVFFTGTNLVLQSCEVVGEDPKYADIVVQPFPSDHRAVVAAFRLNGQTKIEH